MRRVSIAATVSLLTLTACGGGEVVAAAPVTVTATMTSTVTAEPEPVDPVTVTETTRVTETVQAAPEVDDDAITELAQQIAIETTWDGLSTSDQELMCDGINFLGLDSIVDSIEAGWNTDASGGIAFDREITGNYLQEQCDAM